MQNTAKQKYPGSVAVNQQTRWGYSTMLPSPQGAYRFDKFIIMPTVYLYPKY